MRALVLAFLCSAVAVAHADEPPCRGCSSTTAAITSW
jgi:hypothetical protein